MPEALESYKDYLKQRSKGRNMSGNRLTPADDRMCPIYERVIDGELCYETAMCMQGLFHISSVPEADYIKFRFEDAKRICLECPYGDME